METSRRRILHGLFFLVAAVVTLAALFYAVEDWRGARAWAATRHDLQARGESVDPHTFIPPPVPDDQNLAMAPLFVRTFCYQVDPGTRLLTFNRGTDWYKNETYRTLSSTPWGSETNQWGGQDAHKHPWTEQATG